MAADPDHVAVALALLHEGDPEAAREELSIAGDDQLSRAVSAAWTAGGALGAEVYVDPSAFRQFIDSPPNVALYAAVEAELASWIRGGDSSWVVDLGCGDGRLTRAVAPADVDVVELVEPARALIDIAADRFEGQRVDALCLDVEMWTEEVLADDLGSRDVGWSTFALHNLPAGPRLEVLRRVAEGVERFAVAEFDVPRFGSTAEHAAYCARRYRRGVAVHDPFVVSGFLVPVLLGQFVAEAPRHTHEQPLEAWAADFRRAGFVDVEIQRVHSGFWWAPAGLVTGSRPRGVDRRNRARELVPTRV